MIFGQHAGYFLPHPRPVFGCAAIRRLREAGLPFPKRRLCQFPTTGESMAINPIAFASAVCATLPR